MLSCNLHVVNLNLNDSIYFISNLINNEKKFNNLWNNNIFDEKIYNNIVRTLSFFWLDGTDYNKNSLYSFNKFKNIPWYYDFTIYQDRLNAINNISNNDLWKNYNDFNNTNSKHYIANSNTLIKYIPSGYLIPPIDKHLIDISYIVNNDKKYDDFDEIVKKFKHSNEVNKYEEKILLDKLENIFNKLDKNNDNILKSEEFKNLYYTTNNDIEHFSNNDDYKYYIWLQNNQGRVDNELTKKEFMNKYLSSYYSKDISYDNLNKYLDTNFDNLFENKDTTYCPIEVDKDTDNTKIEKTNDDNIEDIHKKTLKQKKKTFKDSIIDIGLWTIAIFIILIISLFFIKTIF